MPWATLRSAVVKPVTGSLKVMVTVLVSPALSAVSLTTMVAVGRTVSTVMAMALSGSVPSALALPAASEKVALATWMEAPVVLLALGVNVAV